MENNEEDGRLSSILLLDNTSHLILLNKSVNNDNEYSGYSLLIIFETVRICSCIFSVLGILGNIALIYVISKTSFRHVSYGLLIIIVALFDSIRLLSSIYYYLLFANVIPLNILSETIYIIMDRYSIFVVNWCKVLMSIERLLTVRYWEHHTHLDWRSKHKKKQHRQFTCAILFILISGLIIQHPNIILRRHQSGYINYKILMLIQKTDHKFYYGYFYFNNILFTIMSYLLFDTTMPLMFVLIVNILLLREIKKLPLSLQVKVKESIGILFFVTILSIAILPRAFISFYSMNSSNQTYDYLKIFIIFFYICLGFEYFNHAITGYACFLSSALLRSELKNMIWTKYIAPHMH